MRNYELTVLLRPDFSSDELQKAQDKISKTLTDAGAKVEKTESWGRKMLAYAIGKYDEAVYVFFSFSMDPANAQTTEESVKRADGVIRHLFVLAEEQGNE